MGEHVEKQQLISEIREQIEMLLLSDDLDEAQKLRILSEAQSLLSNNPRKIQEE
jgi:heme oxygenase